ncbi:terpene cyclase/mutase family protein [Kiritimatiellota bacterium B12222]|nr:terpene cyclase/mutase family protein [Kiritimatiellota bacterium B12222]
MFTFLAFFRFNTLRRLIWSSFLGMLIDLQAQTISPVLAPHADQVEIALDRAFDFLISTQNPDGSFPGEYGKSAGVVALAGMSVLSAGHTPGGDRYGEFINRCIDYVLQQQNEDGYILTSNGRDKGLYSHNISTLFLAEVSGMMDPEREPKVKRGLQEAIQLIIQSQGIKKRPGHEGGWRYTPRSNDSDLSVSGWALMALKAARLNGAMVPEENIEAAVAYMLGNQLENGSFTYQKGNNNGRITLTGLSVLSLNLTGHHDSPEVQRALVYIMKNYRKIPKSELACYALYYNTQSAFQMGGQYWEDVGSWLYDYYLPLQQEDGSWGKNAAGKSSSESKTPVYRTSMIVLSLTVPYRQLPIYQRDETIDE